VPRLNAPFRFFTQLQKRQILHLLKLKLFLLLLAVFFKLDGQTPLVFVVEKINNLP
jgi:hypothetical protein